MQLSGYKFTEKVKNILQPTDEMLLLQRRLVKTILTLSKTTFEKEKKFARRDAAMDTVAAYYRFEEGGPSQGSILEVKP